MRPRATSRAILCAITASSIIVSAGCDYEKPDADRVDHVFGNRGLGSGEFQYPRAITVSPVDDRVYVVDKSARIQRFSPEGKYEHQWRMPEYERGKPTGLHVDRQNRVWVPDTHYQRVMVFDRDGNELFRFGEPGEGPGQFVFPTGVTTDKDGFVYVSEYGENGRVCRFTPELKYIDSFADRDSGEHWIGRPAEMVFDDDGILWIVDAVGDRVCAFKRDGTFHFHVGSPGKGPANFSNPLGIAIEKSGTLLIADRGNNRIARFTRKGEFLGSWGTAGRGVGQIMQPWGVAAGSSGLIYCLDSWNNRVQVIDW